MNLFILLLLIFLFLLCVLEFIFIIKISNETHNRYVFHFKKGTKLYALAYKDDLTDLFNHNAYIRDLEKFKREKFRSLWFSIFDIDNFKVINDTKGHLYGDKILISAANRLCEIFAEKNHTVYRIGGDEFLVISKNIYEEDLVQLLLKLKQTEIESSDFRFSKGYSPVENNSHESFNIAFDNADKMLYADKNSKKHNLFN